jgi:Phospholipid methyltransferase
VRNPIYIAALLGVLGEAWLFLSPPLLMYAGVMALVFHVFVVGYEERTLRCRFGDVYLDYVQAVHRWIPRGPRPAEKSFQNDVTGWRWQIRAQLSCNGPRRACPSTRPALTPVRRLGPRRDRISSRALAPAEL